MDKDISPEILPSFATDQYMNLCTDYGFKRLFGSPKRIHLLKRFLNALFEGRMTVESVEFKDKEMSARSPDGKRTIYDIYCVNREGHHFIIEMQMHDTEHFPERVVYYTSRVLVDQLYRGDDYGLNPIYSIVVANFNLKHVSRRLVSEFIFKERTTHEIFSEDVALMFLSLPEVCENWRDCGSEIERVLYLIRNMHTMTKESEPYRTGEYNEFFEVAELDNLAAEETVAYSKSYYRMLNDRAALNFAAKEARAEGRAEGIAEGRAEGRAEGMAKGRKEGMAKGRAEGMAKGRKEATVSMARKLKSMNVDTDIIVGTTGLSAEEISLL